MSGKINESARVKKGICSWLSVDKGAGKLEIVREGCSRGG